MSRRKRKTPAKEFTPRFLQHHIMMATGALVVCLFMAAGMVERVVKEMGSPYVAAVIAAILVELANDDREALALEEFTVNPLLVEAAQAKADDMAAKSYFSHTSPEGYDSWHWFNEVGYEYQYAGENLAVNFSDSGDVQRAWMASPTHRDNIVNPRYSEIGIATAVGRYEGKEAVFAVQMFGTPKGERKVSSKEASPSVVVEKVPSPTLVLGEAVTAPEEEVSFGALAEEDGDAAILSSEEIPWWGWLIAQPRQSLQYAYYIIGLLIIAALFFDFEWELHKHHLRHAMKAGTLLATMSMLFIAADWVFFAEPVLAVLGIT